MSSKQLDLKHKHPFIEGLKKIPEGKKKDMQKIKQWMSSQPHMPEVSEDFIYLFLHACYYSHEKTKSALECWFTIRASYPNIFSDRDPYEQRMMNILDMGEGSLKYDENENTPTIQPILPTTKITKKTTIMPVFLKKMQQKLSTAPEAQEGELDVTSRLCLRENTSEHNLDPHSSSVLHRASLSSRGLRTMAQRKKSKISTTLIPRKNARNMNLKSFSQLLVTKPVRNTVYDMNSDSCLLSKNHKTVQPPGVIDTKLGDANRIQWPPKSSKRIGTMKRQPNSTIHTTSKYVESEKMESKKEKQYKAPESFTYKIVSKVKKCKEKELKDFFEIKSKRNQNMGFLKNYSTKSEGSSRKNSDLESTKAAIVSNLSRKPFIGNIVTSRRMQSNPHCGKHISNLYNLIRYLLRLPKHTPEGYRVMMYAVKDPDPTKMNFNDVVKGFCMYNDCVLSEDGLEEGYIVIFDMKGVSIGHLARVSLPALKCFMFYIQDAHPCRLKSIHVLNTASWIQHVMRLIVPLTRSELLSLVKFHKGSIPEDFPTEILPMDYGGEAPSIEDLDTSTKSLLHKYRDWLVESAQLKADETKRTKKASWWGLFGGKSAEQVELDEKTILKNLQID